MYLALCAGLPVLTLHALAAASPDACSPWLTVSVEEHAAKAAFPTLRLRVSTTGNYPCLGYTIPLRLDTGGPRLRVNLGEVQRPSGHCLAALGPAEGIVEIPIRASGDFALEVANRREIDRYQLFLSETEIRLTPKQVCTTTSGTPQSLRRVPASALGVSCSKIPDSCSAGDGAGLSCATFFAEPPLKDLPPLPASSGGFTMPWISFGVPNEYKLSFQKFEIDTMTRVFATGDLAAIRRLFAERYAMSASCLSLQARSARGEVISNQNANLN